MENFNKIRFKNYAYWDLTINKSFYRNIFIILALSIIVLAILASLWSYLISGIIDFNTNIFWVVLAVSPLIFMFYFFLGGCVFHPLRNKQGRITNLTIPATNLEKYLWHLLICIGGCFVVSSISIIISDAINACIVGTLMGWNNVESLTKFFFVFCTEEDICRIFQVDDSYHTFVKDNIEAFLWYDKTTKCLNVCHIIIATSVFVFINSIKYKFNIPITLILLYAITMIFVSIFIIISIFYGDLNITLMETIRSTFDFIPEEYLHIIGICLICGIELLISGFLFTKAYHNYCKAQLVNGFNK